MMSGTMMTTTAVKKIERAADGLAAAVAISLPWSTSATSILIVLWLIALVPTLQWSDLRRELVTPPGGFPVLLWLLALVGVLWSDVSLSERLSGLGGYHKLLAIPLLLAQFRRSEHTEWVIVGFFLASVALLLVSWSPIIFSDLTDIAWKKFPGPPVLGVPVKDYLSQSTIFQLCIFASAYVAVAAWHGCHKVPAIIFAGLALLFLGNLIYLVSSRTALVIMPMFVLLLGFRFFGWRGVIAGCLAGTIVTGLVWSSSEYIRTRLTSIPKAINHERSVAEITSTGVRFEFYRESVAIIAKAPIIGHGTGTIPARFKEASAGKTGAAGIATTNPHQQTFAVAVQLGIVGAAVLWAMWIAHLMLFGSSGAFDWFGLLIVAENILTSLFNSNLFDFTHGWLYVFGVGVLGGAVLRQKATHENLAAIADASPIPKR